MVDRTNLRVLKGSRRRPVAGDIFAMRFADLGFLFGRVVVAEPPRDQAPMPGAYLVYVYDRCSEDKEVIWCDLHPHRLLIPPVWINRMPWTKGYFETVGSRPLVSDDLLSQHCFRVWTGAYVDEVGRELACPVEPCGDWALSSYRWLDDRISDALGFPRVDGS